MSIIRDISDLMTSLSKRVSLIIMSFIAIILLLLIIAVVDSYLFSKSPRYVFGMKFGPERSFEATYDPADYLKYDTKKRSSITANMFTYSNVAMTESDCMNTAEAFVKTYNGVYEVQPGTIYAYFNGSTSTEVVMVIRCQQWRGKNISNVQFAVSGIARNTHDYLDRIKDIFEEKFPKGNVELIEK